MSWCSSLDVLDRTPLRRRRQFLALERRESSARARRFLLPDRPADRINALRHQFLGVEGRAAHQQFIEQYSQAVDVAARVYVQPAHLRLFRTHIRRRADELLQLRVHRRVGQPPFRGLGDAKINHLGHWDTIMQGDEDIQTSVKPPIGEKNNRKFDIEVNGCL